MFALILAACATPESDDADHDEPSDTLAWHVEILGECPSTYLVTWTPPANVVHISVRTDRADGTTIWSVGSQLSAAEDGMMALGCIDGDEFVVTYAVAGADAL